MSDMPEVVASEVQEPVTSDVPVADSGEPAAEAPKQEAISGKLGTLLRREQQFQAKVKAEKDRLNVERRQFETEKAEIESLRAKYARVKEDPIEGLREAGLSYEELTRNIINSNTPEAKIDALQKKIELLEQSRQAEQQQVQQKQAAQQIESGKELYKSHIFSNTEKYPTLALYDEVKVREAAWNIATQYYNKTQIAPDAEQVAEYLEKQAIEEFNAFEALQARRKGIPAQEASKPLAKTLSNSKTSQRSLPELPPDFDKLPKSKQKEVEAEYLSKHLWR